ncbi:mitotic spindle assembly checkpoint protein MAD2 [Cryptococcus wingfieldii CBS 7118]|uniref:Mitotic spindle assembly checkpoint protein MAD2 n=1 Tax=Cryptococcus wingfieldii CBS 7118 TaxID=1295528 RepID=A0A1E3JIA3_9TREE|nr:mitotic spindle assembly checkpoint protein MAD2 [Cryptococcus wingfieldii CBS 7118]ODO00563.1 mitotic spindle assembly checkpoint protein MAD2 [Cryptococcus wingfieldii CBS 7118]
MDQKQRTNQSITLKGSAAIVTEFFDFSINSILYQRGVYSMEDFKIVKKYGLHLFMLSHEDLRKYISLQLEQVHEWILTSSVECLVLAIKSVDTEEPVERWQFDLRTDESVLQSPPGAPTLTAKEVAKEEKTEKEAQGEIREIMKQFTSSVKFLPMLDEDEYSFRLIIHTHEGSELLIVPAAWEDADPHLIDRGKVEQVSLPSFSTNQT